jgi:hypothetical protein
LSDGKRTVTNPPSTENASGYHVHEVYVGDATSGAVRANLTVAENSSVSAWQTRGARTMNRSAVLLDGDYVWDTGADWDGSALSQGVVHDSFGDHDAGTVALGYPDSDRNGSALVSYWPLDGNTEEVSGNDFDATTSGSPTTGFGTYGTGAYDFDGSNDFLEVPHASGPGTALDMNRTNEVTVSMWVNQDTAGSGWTALLQRSDRSYNLHLADGGRPTFTIYDTTWRSAEAPTDIGTDEWHHLVGTFNGSTVEMYVDGDRVATTGADFVRSANQPIRIGANPPASGGNRNFDGKIDEVRVYDRALSADEIDTLAGGHGRVVTGWHSGSQPLDSSNMTLAYNASVPSSPSVSAWTVTFTDVDAGPAALYASVMFDEPRG